MTMLALIARRYRAWRRYETVLRELAQLTDRELADIGISRSDIDRIASWEPDRNKARESAMHEVVIIVALLWTVGGLFICGVLRQRGGH